ncbi:transmembrane protein 272-like isoform 2-T2 [Odontesthes bonariensis]
MAADFRLICLCSALLTGTCLTGTVYLHECPAAPVLPVYVMVSGIGALMMMASFALPKLLSPTAQSHNIWIVWLIALSLLFFVWLLFGSYQIYSIYPPHYDRNTTSINTSVNQSQTWRISENLTLGNIQTSTGSVAPYCNRTVYLFAFWTTALAFVAAGITLMTVICLYGCMKFTEKFVKYLTT